MPEPATDNFFLGSMVAQWRSSGRGEAPAILRADRTLALAYEGTRLTREEFLEQANWAVGAKRLDVAKALFEAALKLDPLDPRGKAGARLVEKLDKGEISLEELRKASVNTDTRPARERRSTGPGRSKEGTGRRRSEGRSPRRSERFAPPGRSAAADSRTAR